MPSDSRLLLLVSGGASALAEASTIEDMSLAGSCSHITDEMIAGGKTIAEINARRKQCSLIKDGKLIQSFRGAEIRVYAISDVEGRFDRDHWLGHSATTSSSRFRKRVQRSSRRTGLPGNDAESKARQIGLGNPIRNQRRIALWRRIRTRMPRLGTFLSGAEPGVYIWGGEPTVVLPDRPGAAAGEIKASHWPWLSIFPAIPNICHPGSRHRRYRRSYSLLPVESRRWRLPGVIPRPRVRPCATC